MWRALAVLVIAGCYTGYHPVGWTGGYYETQVNDRAFQVHFSGNGYSSESYSAQMALRRAAELTVLHGFDGFVIAGQNTSSSTSTYYNSSNGATSLISKPSSDITIVMMKLAERERTGGVFYDAKMLLAQYETK